MIASAAATPPPPPVLALPGADLRAAPPLPGAPGPVPADLAGWSVVGGLGAVPVPGGVRLAGNATLVSPPVAVPPTAQVLVVRAASRGGAVLTVRAVPETGEPPVALAVVAAPPSGAPLAVPVGAVAGRTVRIALDPTTAFGGTLDVREVGPFAGPLPGWTLTGAATRPVEAGGRAALEVREEPAELRSPAVLRPAAVRAVLVAARGPGRVRVRAGGRWVDRPVGALWTDVRAEVPTGARRLVLQVRADPEGDRLLLRDVGLLVQRVGPRALRAEGRGRRVVVRGDLGRAGARLPVVVRQGRRTVARTRSTDAGTFRTTALTRPGGGRLTLEVVGDRTRVGVRVPLRVRAAPRSAGS